MELGWINDLKVLATTGNFSRAAKDNNISQSAFSRRIQALEVWAGTSLVDRSNHPVKLTSAGEQLLEVGTQALIHLELVRSQISPKSATLGPQVIFAAQHAIGWRFYPQWINQLEQSFGSIRSRLLADNLPDCFAALLNVDADFVLGFESSEYRYICAEQRKIESQVVGHDRLIPVSLANEHGEAIFSLNDNYIPFLNYPSNAPLGMHLAPVLNRKGLNSKLSLVYENAMTEAIRMRTRNGDGVSWLPQTLVMPDIDNGLLAIIGTKDLIIELDICLYRYTSNNNKLAAQIWNCLRELVL